jgi:mannose-6-phosphate isomerase-like protein (cupin superfamily)
MIGASERAEIVRAAENPDDTAPDGSKIFRLLDQRQGLVKAGICEVELGAGMVSKPVWHHTVEELWYILAGEGLVWRCPPDEPATGGFTKRIRRGDALLIPTGWRFQFQAEHDGPLRFLCFDAPPWPGKEEAEPAETGALTPPAIHMS